MPEKMTTLVIFSLAPFTCMKNKTTRTAFREGYRQRNNRIPCMKIHERCTDGDAGQYQERDENKNVKPD